MSLQHYYTEISLQAAMEIIVLLKNNETIGLPLGQVDEACASMLHHWYNTLYYIGNMNQLAIYFIGDFSRSPTLMILLFSYSLCIFLSLQIEHVDTPFY